MTAPRSACMVIASLIFDRPLADGEPERLMMLVAGALAEVDAEVNVAWGEPKTTLELVDELRERGER